MAELTVMTWNVQNLFPAGTEFGPATQQDHDDKIAALAGVIDAVEPDVPALQEVGPDEVLVDLNAACSFPTRLMCSGGWLCSDTKLTLKMRLPPDTSADHESVTRLDALRRLDPPGLTTG